MGSNQENRRHKKSLLINPAFQLKFLSYILIAVFITTFSIFFLMKAFFFSGVENYLHTLGIANDHVAFVFLQKQSSQMNLILMIALVAELIVLSVLGLALSHRVAGPMYRLVTDLKMISETKQPKAIKFRKNDFFPEVAESVNKFLEK